jgi:hypothetical protein
VRREIRRQLRDAQAADELGEMERVRPDIADRRGSAGLLRIRAP